jgi:hypothetical protein
MRSAKLLAIVALTWLMVAEITAAGPETSQNPGNLKSGRYSLPSSLFEKPFIFAGETVPLQRPDVQYRIMRHVNFLLLDARSVLTEWLAEKSSYSWIFHETFVREGMPKEFSLLAPILASLNVKAPGRAAGVGWWYLTRPCTTAEGVEMAEDSWRDDRLDPELSTRCFAARLKELRKELGGDSWLMAMAAYLTSGKTIQDLQDRWNTKVFWDLPLPEIAEETIVRWMALSIIDANRTAFGLKFKDPAPAVFDQVTGLILAKDLPVAEIARVIGVPPRDIAKLNPKMKPSVAAFPAKAGATVPSHTIAVPKGAGEKLLEWLKRDGYLAQPAK